MPAVRAPDAAKEDRRIALFASRAADPRAALTSARDRRRARAPAGLRPRAAHRRSTPPRDIPLRRREPSQRWGCRRALARMTVASMRLRRWGPSAGGEHRLADFLRLGEAARRRV